MSYNPFDGKPPKTLGQTIVQNHLGQHGVATGGGLANIGGLEAHKRRKEREEKKSEEGRSGSWWSRKK